MLPTNLAPGDRGGRVSLLLACLSLDRAGRASIRSDVTLIALDLMLPINLARDNAGGLDSGGCIPSIASAADAISLYMCTGSLAS